MKIISSDNKSWISIEGYKDKEYPSFDVEAFVNIQHGKFFANNSGLEFLNLSSFIVELDKFISNRELSPKLEGTYNSFIVFRKSKHGNEIIIHFSIGDAYSGYSETNEYCLKGSFELNQEYITKVLENFKKLDG